MSPLEHEWREWLAGNDRVRAMDRESLRKVHAVWLHGAQGTLAAIAASHPEGKPAELAELVATMEGLNDEIMAGLTKAHGREN